jgi:hypothetical protein
VFLGDPAERTRFIETGICRQLVDASRLGPDPRNDPVEIGKVRNIAPEPRDVAADRGDGLVALGFAPTGVEYARAFLREALGDPEADPGAATR